MLLPCGNVVTTIRACLADVIANVVADVIAPFVLILQMLCQLNTVWLVPCTIDQPPYTQMQHCCMKKNNICSMH